MTFLTLDAINSNALFAPIGHEEEFKRRIFLDNFQRAMTIREFQKTAGLEIKKKIYKTKTATLITDELDKIQNRSLTNSPMRFRHCQITRISRNFGLDHCKLKSFYKYKHYTAAEQDATFTKTGKFVQVREERFYRLLAIYTNHIGYMFSGQPRRRYIADFLIRIGIDRFLRSFDFSKKLPAFFDMDQWVEDHKNTWTITV